MTIAFSYINGSDNLYYLEKTRFPYHIGNSVKRHGFRDMHTTVNSLMQNQMRNDGSPDLLLVREFNEVLVDYWQNAMNAESGSLTKIGTNDVKLGKCLEFDKDVPYYGNKRYYIEGYTDDFEVFENGDTLWTQTLSLTRGFEKSDLQTNARFAVRDEEFKQSGEFTESN